MKPIDATLDTQRASRFRCSRFRQACKMRTSSPPSESPGTVTFTLRELLEALGGVAASPSDGKETFLMTGEEGAVVARDGKPERA